MGDDKRGATIGEAEKELFQNGAPGAAREYLWRFSDDHDRNAHYWRLMAAATFLAEGEKGKDKAVECLKELPKGRTDENFLKFYVSGVEALARRRRSLFARSRARRDKIVDFNINYAIKILKKIDGNTDELEKRLTDIRSQP